MTTRGVPPALYAVCGVAYAGGRGHLYGARGGGVGRGVGVVGVALSQDLIGIPHLTKYDRGP